MEFLVCIANWKENQVGYLCLSIDQVSPGVVLVVSGPPGSGVSGPDPVSDLLHRAQLSFVAV